MCKANFIGSSITDEEHLAKYIKDVIDDEDAYEFVCDLGSVIGWCKDTVTNDGISLATAMNPIEAIDNYQSAYTYISNDNTTNVRKRKMQDSLAVV